jgi:hypothetical protein
MIVRVSPWLTMAGAALEPLQHHAPLDPGQAEQ